jgi:3alpha(or 20beta)-hydroxysteroid dehydrogenase
MSQQGERRRFDGKVALVTGGARGIGASAVRRLVSEGCQVVITDILDELGEKLQAELGPATAYQHLDVTSEAEWTAAVDRAATAFGPPHVLVSNAGIMIVKPFQETTKEDFQRAFDINAMGAFYGIRAVTDPMREHGGGSIVTLSSSAGYVGVEGLTAYCTSKAANAMIARCAAIELGPLGIRVNSIHPSGIDTDMSNSEAVAELDPSTVYARLPLGRIGYTHEAAGLIAFLASDDASYITGGQYLLDGGGNAGTKFS